MPSVDDASFMFGDLHSVTGVRCLDQFLANRSYVSGHCLSESDIVIFEALGTCPMETFLHACRWYRHIASYQPATKVCMVASDAVAQVSKYPSPACLLWSACLEEIASFWKVIVSCA
ncbi:hypothetical protein PR048_026581 [Dryococelus australis]|uniref:Uncharacterized protein n=1 Tax=Dryococelus australis TaxID=614101 RepID=A0ABQ9GLR6_9NEOP|nr:hypothetical protein PR048_026581 [Dryococelus australis]